MAFEDTSNVIYVENLRWSEPEQQFDLVLEPSYVNSI
jgi:hypothetical protein